MIKNLIKGMADVIPFLQNEQKDEAQNKRSPKIHSAPLIKFQETIGYRFNNLSLLTEALTHASYASQKGLPSNQRLEFLGDAVLELAISRYLFEEYPSLQEGKLTHKRSSLVRNVALAELAKEIGMEDVLLLGQELRNMKDKNDNFPTSPFACAVESVFGAIYIDSDFATAERVVRAFVPRLIKIASLINSTGNPKGELQEYIQQTSISQPKYKLLSQEGDGTNFTFTVQVSVDDEILAKGEGSSIRNAEVDAAQNALNKIKGNA